MIKAKNIVIADGGASKTDWRIIIQGGKVFKQSTGGINFNVTPLEEINSILKSLPAELKNSDSDFFIYASGYSSAYEQNKLRDLILQEFQSKRNEIRVSVNSDIIGTVAATTNYKEGLVCILGTGANVCFCDNDKSIIQRTPSLGYILGDEGSGNYIGKKLLVDFLYNKMPTNIHDLFHKEFQLTKEIIIEHVYRKPNAGSYVASFVPFAVKNISSNYIFNLVKNGFHLFADTHLLPYPEFKTHQTHFTGSVAFHFSDLLKQVIKEKGGSCGKIIKAPIDELVKFHTNVV